MPNTLPLLIVLLPILFFYLRMFTPYGGDTCGHHPRYPRAFQVAPFEAAPIVDVDALEITLDGLPEGKLVELDKTDYKIVRLFDNLTRFKNDYALLHPHTAFPASIILAADRDTPFWAIERVRYTALLAGYPDTQYVVENADD